MPCSIEGCDREIGRGSRGWCSRHYARWWRHGDPLAMLIRVGQSPERRLFDRLVMDGECWLWTGATSGAGYGQIKVDGKSIYTHRLAYELLVGQIPDGLTLDHLCRRILCCNPDHLDPVPKAVNSARAAADRTLATVTP